MFKKCPEQLGVNFLYLSATLISSLISSDKPYTNFLFQSQQSISCSFKMSHFVMPLCFYRYCLLSLFRTPLVFLLNLFVLADLGQIPLPL